MRYALFATQENRIIAVSSVPKFFQTFVVKIQNLIRRFLQLVISVMDSNKIAMFSKCEPDVLVYRKKACVFFLNVFLWQLINTNYVSIAIELSRRN